MPVKQAAKLRLKRARYRSWLTSASSPQTLALAAFRFCGMPPCYNIKSDKTHDAYISRAKSHHRT